MSSFDLATLRSAVRFRGDYQNTKKFPDTDVNREIQAAFAEFYEFVADTYEGYFDTETTVTTQADIVALPSDLWRLIAIDRRESTGEYVELRRISPSIRTRSTTDEAKPVGFRLVATGAKLYPDSDGTYTYRVVYVPLAPALGESTAREYFNGWESFVINSALLRLDQREQKPLQERLAIMDREKARIVSGATRRNSQEPEYLNLREVDLVDPWDQGIF